MCAEVVGSDSNSFGLEQKVSGTGRPFRVDAVAVRDETFSTQLLDDRATQWIEPAWKLILSSKGILPILWELNPSDPNLLEAYFESGRLSRYAKKPSSRAKAPT